jgi:hypothetical protein
MFRLPGWKRGIWVGVILCVIGLIFIMRIASSKPNLGTMTPRQPSSETRKNIRQILSSPIEFKDLDSSSTRLAGNSSESKSKIVEEKPWVQMCKENWHGLLNSPGRSWQDLSSEMELSLDSNCISLMGSSPHLQALTQALQNCLKPSIAIENAASTHSDLCEEMVFKWRSLIVEFLYQNNSDYGNQTEEVLLNRILAGMQLEKPDGEQLSKMLKMTEVLIERDPNSYPANKARASLLVLILANLNQGSLQEVDDALDRVAALEDEDQEIQEVKLVIPMLLGNPQEMERRAEELLQKEPNHPAALYLTAGSLWQKGHTSETISRLQKVVSLAPEVGRYKETLDRVVKAKPMEKGLFSVSMSVNLLGKMN